MSSLKKRNEMAAIALGSGKKFAWMAMTAALPARTMSSKSRTQEEEESTVKAKRKASSYDTARKRRRSKGSSKSEGRIGMDDDGAVEMEQSKTHTAASGTLPSPPASPESTSERPTNRSDAMLASPLRVDVTPQQHQMLIEEPALDLSAAWKFLEKAIESKKERKSTDVKRDKTQVKQTQEPQDPQQEALLSEPARIDEMREQAEVELQRQSEDAEQPTPISDDGDNDAGNDRNDELQTSDGQVRLARNIEAADQSFASGIVTESKAKPKQLPVAEKKRLFFDLWPTEIISELRQRIEDHDNNWLKHPLPENQCQLDHHWLQEGVGKKRAVKYGVSFRHGGRTISFDLHYGVLKLLFKGRLTKAMIDGLCSKKSWHLSHLCGNWHCCNAHHMTIEPGSINLSRNGGSCLNDKGYTARMLGVDLSVCPHERCPEGRCLVEFKLAGNDVRPLKEARMERDVRPRVPRMPANERRIHDQIKAAERRDAARHG